MMILVSGQGDDSPTAELPRTVTVTFVPDLTRRPITTLMLLMDEPDVVDKAKSGLTTLPARAEL